MDNIAKMFSKALDSTAIKMNAIGVFFLAGMMFLTGADVIMRYIFRNPILGAFEVQELMMAVLVAFGVAYVGIRKEHVIIDTAIAFLKPGARVVIEAITNLVSFLYLSLVTWRLFVFAQDLLVSNQGTPALHIPVWLFVYIVALGFALVCLVFLRNVIEHLGLILQKNRRMVSAALLVLITIVLLLFATPIFAESSLWKISPTDVGIIGFVLLVFLLCSGMPIGVVMGVVGFLGMTYIIGLKPGLTNIGTTPYSSVASYDLSVIPLFILMGDLCFHSGISSDLYKAAYKILGRLPGGLAIATIGACAAFGAVTGSSVAAVATIGSVSLPEMKRYKYDMGMATGCIAAAGGLGVLIPPSVILALYGILAQQSIGKLFLAGFLPGILQAVFLMGTVIILCIRNPRLGPRGESSSLLAKITALRGTWGVLILFLLVIGGIYTGIITITEAAGIGALGAFLFAVLTRRLKWNGFITSIRDTGKLTAICFFLLIGANILGYFLAVTRLPFELASTVAALDVSPYVILTVIILLYIFLGCFISSLALIVLTVPIFIPVVASLGFDLIWFGVIITMMVEIGAITPPFAINVFVIHGLDKSIPISSTFRGMVPFLYADLVLVIVLVAFPQISLFLPHMMR